jgi:hypothetical protein
VGNFFPGKMGYRHRSHLLINRKINNIPFGTGFASTIAKVRPEVVEEGAIRSNPEEDNKCK